MTPEIQEPDFTLPVTEEEYAQAGSKFVQFPPGAKRGDTLLLAVECGMLDWDTPGKSMKIPVTVIEKGVNDGKEDKISFGVDAKGIWKGKEIYKAISGKEMPKAPNGHPRPDRKDINGKKAVGVWVVVEGRKGGTGDSFDMPKLQSILPIGTKIPDSLGI